MIFDDNKDHEGFPVPLYIELILTVRSKILKRIEKPKTIDSKHDPIYPPIGPHDSSFQFSRQSGQEPPGGEGGRGGGDGDSDLTYEASSGE